MHRRLVTRVLCASAVALATLAGAAEAQTTDPGGDPYCGSWTAGHYIDTDKKVQAADVITLKACLHRLDAGHVRIDVRFTLKDPQKFGEHPYGLRDGAFAWEIYKCNTTTSLDGNTNHGIPSLNIQDGTNGNSGPNTKAWTSGPIAASFVGTQLEFTAGGNAKTLEFYPQYKFSPATSFGARSARARSACV